MTGSIQPIATIGAGILGFLGGIISTFGIYWLRKRERKEKLRKAMLVELQLPKATINKAAKRDEISDDAANHTSIPDTVYRSHEKDLGLLTGYELKPILGYYNSVDIASEQLQNFDQTSIRRQFCEETAPILKLHRDEAERRLNSSIGWFSRLSRARQRRSEDTEKYESRWTED